VDTVSAARNTIEEILKSFWKYRGWSMVLTFADNAVNFYLLDRYGLPLGRMLRLFEYWTWLYMAEFLGW